MFGPADDDVGLDSDLAEFGDRLLGWLGFDFTRRPHHREKGDMNEADRETKDKRKEPPAYRERAEPAGGREEGRQEAVNGEGRRKGQETGLRRAKANEVARGADGISSPQP